MTVNDKIPKRAVSFLYIFSKKQHKPICFRQGIAGRFFAERNAFCHIFFSCCEIRAEMRIQSPVNIIAALI